MKATRAFRKLQYLLKRRTPGIIAGGDCGMCNQSDREVWLKRTLAEIPGGSRILDAGAGELQYKLWCAHLNYVSQDFAQYDGNGDSVGLQTHQWDNSQLDIISDITAIPEPDESFDAIMCIEVLEHLPDPIKALRELARLLKFGGLLIITAPFCSLTHFSPYFFHTGYSRYFYDHWLAQLGLTVEEMQWNGNYFEYMAQELRRLPAIGEEYSKESLSSHEWAALNTLLTLTHRLSQHDHGSEQLLAFGLHIKARKIAQ